MCVRTIVVSNKFIIDNSPFPAVKLRPCRTYDKMLAGRRISRINRLRASTSFYLPSAFLRLLANFLSRSQIAEFPARLQKRVAYPSAAAASSTSTSISTSISTATSTLPPVPSARFVCTTFGVCSAEPFG